MAEPAGARAAAPLRELVTEFDALGVVAFTTTRAAGDFSLATPGLAASNASRWERLQASLAPAASGLVSATQVHGVAVAHHRDPWSGWRRLDGVDAHVVGARGGAAAVTVADCVPVFIAHPSGTVALVHAGWRGIAAGLLPSVLDLLASHAVASADVHVHLGPAICGRCYEVGPDVYERLTGWSTVRHRHVDLRALLAEQARAAGVAHVSASVWCTRCDNERFFSHRAGDAARQIAVLLSPQSSAA